MKTTLVNVTPQMAAQILKGNTSNRPLRPAHVARLRASFERGEYVMTHQGIAVSKDGRLIDGQHRLTAIAQMADGWSFPMLMTTELVFNEAFGVVDAIVVPRSVADVLKEDRKIVEVGFFICRLMHYGYSATPALVAPYVEMTKDTTENLLAFCGSQSKTWGSASVRSAAVVAIMRGYDADYVRAMYRALVVVDVQAMTPVVVSLFRSHLSGKVRATERNDLFVRCLKAFNPENSMMSRIQIKNVADEIAVVRAWVQGEMKNAPDKAGAKRSVTGKKFSTGKA